RCLRLPLQPPPVSPGGPLAGPPSPPSRPAGHGDDERRIDESTNAGFGGPMRAFEARARRAVMFPPQGWCTPRRLGSQERQKTDLLNRAGGEVDTSWYEGAAVCRGCARGPAGGGV